MAKSKRKSSPAQRATPTTTQKAAGQQSATKQGTSTQKTQSPTSGGQKTSAAQRREALRSQQVASAERNRAKTRTSQSHTRGRKQASPPVSPIIWVAVALLVIAAVVAIFFYLSKQPASTSSSSSIAINGRKPAPAQVVNQVTNVSPSVLQAVDIGNVTTKPIYIPSQPALNGPNGKPEFFYFGAEYCPYCAAQRWSMLVALSRFGTFQNLSITTSSASDVYASTPTFSFYGSSYSSSYIDFVSVETTTNQPDGNGGYVTLETPTADEQQIVNKYDAPPYRSDGQYSLHRYRQSVSDDRPGVFAASPRRQKLAADSQRALRSQFADCPGHYRHGQLPDRRDLHDYQPEPGLGLPGGSHPCH